MRVNIHTVVLISYICTVCILIEYIACKLWVWVLVRSSGLIFGQVWLWPEYSMVLLAVPLHPLVPGFTVE